MDSNDELNEVDIKHCIWYFFDDIVKIEGFDLRWQITQKYILVYKISYKTLIGAKQLHSRLDKVDGFNRAYDRTKYLVLFGLETERALGVLCFLDNLVYLYLFWLYLSSGWRKSLYGPFGVCGKCMDRLLKGFFLLWNLIKL